MTKSDGLTLDSVVARGEGQVSTEVDGEALLMSIERGKYYGMDRVGSRIWSAIDRPRPVREICDELVEAFEVDRERCEREVVAFLDQLVARKLARVVRGGG